MVTKVNQQVFVNDAGRELVVIKDGTATVSPHTVTAKELLDLSEACESAARILEESAGRKGMPTGGPVPDVNEMMAAAGMPVRVAE